MGERAEIGIIGGSGLYQMEGFTEVREISVETPFGPPSDSLMVGSLEGRRSRSCPATAAATESCPTSSTSGPTSSP